LTVNVIWSTTISWI